MYTSEVLAREYQLPENRIKLLYKAVDLSFFEFKPRPAKPPTKFLFVKNDWKRGGLDLLVEAFSKLEGQEKMEFIVAGILPSQQETVKEIIRQSGFTGTYRMMGLVKRNELKSLMAEADLFVNFSRQEALGVSCLEAMASGLPVLASDAGGLKEVLNFGKAGFMVPSEDVVSLTQVLEKMIKDPTLLTEKSLAALEHVKTFSVEKLRENVDGLFNFLPDPK